MKFSNIFVLNIVKIVKNRQRKSPDIQWIVICYKIKSGSVSQLVTQGHLLSCPQTLSGQLKEWKSLENGKSQDDSGTIVEMQDHSTSFSILVSFFARAWPKLPHWDLLTRISLQNMIIIKIIATLQCIVPEFYNPNEDDGKAELSELCVGELHVEYLEPAIHQLFKSFVMLKLQQTSICGMKEEK